MHSDLRMENPLSSPSLMRTPDHPTLHSHTLTNETILGPAQGTKPKARMRVRDGSRYEARHERPAGRLAGPTIAMILLAMSACHSPSTSTRPADGGNVSASACRIAEVDTKPLRLADGRLVSIDPQSLALSGKQVLALGTFVYAWPVGARAGALFDTSARLVGVVLDPDGNPRPVRQPLAERRALYPRAVEDGHGGWHVVFVTASPASEDHPNRSIDSGSVWYAHFDGAQWTRTQRLTTAEGASLGAELSSGLASASDRIAFAYPFERRESQGARGGIVLASLRDGRWQWDTAWTSDVPTYVRLAAGEKAGTWTVGIVRGYLRDGRFRASSLFLAEHDSTLGPQVLAAGDGVRPVNSPTLLRIAGDLRLAWAAEQFGSGDSAAVESAMRVRGDTTIRGSRRVLESQQSYRYEAVALQASTVLWLVPATGGGTGVHVLAAGLAGRVSDLGVLPLPMDSPKPRTVTLSPSRLLIVTSALGRSPDAAPVTTSVTYANVACRR